MSHRGAINHQREPADILARLAARKTAEASLLPPPYGFKGLGVVRVDAPANAAAHLEEHDPSEPLLDVSAAGCAPAFLLHHHQHCVTEVTDLLAFHMEATERLPKLADICPQIISIVDFTELIPEVDARVDEGVKAGTNFPCVELGNRPPKGLNILPRHRPPSIPPLPKQALQNVAGGGALRELVERSQRNTDLLEPDLTLKRLAILPVIAREEPDKYDRAACASTRRTAGSSAAAPRMIARFPVSTARRNLARSRP